MEGIPENIKSKKCLRLNLTLEAIQVLALCFFVDTQNCSLIYKGTFSEIKDHENWLLRAYFFTKTWLIIVDKTSGSYAMSDSVKVSLLLSRGIESRLEC